MSRDNIKPSRVGNLVAVNVNPSIYPLDVIYSAAYVLMDRAYVLIDGDPYKRVTVELRPKNKGTDLEKLGRSFNNELLNYCMYKTQVEKNSEIRRAIIQRALVTNEFAGDDIDDPEGYVDDPEGIAIPWEEKHGRKTKSK